MTEILLCGMPFKVAFSSVTWGSEWNVWNVASVFP